MPERPDLRQIARDIREALADYDREALLEMLTHVFREYVVDGVPPVLLGRADTIEELGELSFPELIRTLQTRLAHPELELFQVQDDVVLVRAAGALTPLTEDQVPRRSPAPTGLSGQSDVPGAELRPNASTREARERGRGDLLGTSAGSYTGQTARPGGPNDMNRGTAPPPRRGLSIAGRNTNAPGSEASAASRGSAAPAAEARQSPADGAPGTRRAEARPQSRDPASSPAQEGHKPAQDGDDSKQHPEGDDPSSIRFSLLELD